MYNSNYYRTFLKQHLAFDKVSPIQPFGMFPIFFKVTPCFDKATILKMMPTIKTFGCLADIGDYYAWHFLLCLKKKISVLARRLPITTTLVLSMTNSWITFILNTILWYHHTPDVFLIRNLKILSCICICMYILMFYYLRIMVFCNLF